MASSPTAHLAHVARDARPDFFERLTLATFGFAVGFAAVATAINHGWL